jgi:tetratricopeptide (TPR) repeat protein
MVERYKEAHIAASASRDDEAAATASTQLAANAANRLEDYVQARVWLAVAQGDVARLAQESLPAAFLAEAEGEVALADRNFDLAIAKIDQALDRLRRLLGPDHPWTIVAEVNKGDWLERSGRLEDALTMDRRAIAHFERVVGPSHPQTAFALNNLGEVLNTLRAFDEAETAYERALTIFRNSGSDKYLLAWVLTGIGRARVGMKRPESAVRPLEEALAIREQTNAPAQLAETRFNLARALWHDPDRRDRARALALAARADAQKTPDALAEIDTWLATTGPQGRKESSHRH